MSAYPQEPQKGSAFEETLRGMGLKRPTQPPQRTKTISPTTSFPQASPPASSPAINRPRQGLGANPQETIRREAESFGLSITSGKRSAAQNAKAKGSPTSYHLDSEALDLAGEPSSMRKFTEHMRDNYGSSLAELYHDPVGGWKFGQSIGAIGDHSDHVHVAWGRRGGDNFKSALDQVRGPGTGIQGSEVGGQQLASSPERPDFSNLAPGTPQHAAAIDQMYKYLSAGKHLKDDQAGGQVQTPVPKTSGAPEPVSAADYKPLDLSPLNRPAESVEIGERGNIFDYQRIDSKPKRDYSSTQVNLPPALADKVKSLGRLIPDEDLAEDGRETDPHITVKFGLHGEDPEAVRRALAGEGPIRVKLGKTSIFPAKEGASYDVVKIDVDSPDLHRLNKKIADALPHTDTHPTYKPHVTLAYVKPGQGKKYEGDSSFEGQEIMLDRIAFSSKSGNVVEIPLAAPSVGALSEGDEPLKLSVTHPKDEPVGRFVPTPELGSETLPQSPAEGALARAQQGGREFRGARPGPVTSADRLRSEGADDRTPGFEIDVSDLIAGGQFDADAVTRRLIAQSLGASATEIEELKARGVFAPVQGLDDPQKLQDYLSEDGKLLILFEPEAFDDYRRALSQIREEERVRSSLGEFGPLGLSEAEREPFISSVAQRRPITEEERELHGLDEGGLTGRALGGINKGAGRITAGIGHVLDSDTLKETGEAEQKTGQFISNRYGQEGLAGELAETAGGMAPALAGAVALGPQSLAGEMAYWGGVSGLEALGEGAAPGEALRRAAIGAAPVPAFRPLRRVASSPVEGMKRTVGQAVKEELPYTAGRVGVGAVTGAETAALQGAPPEEIAKGALIGGLTALPPHARSQEARPGRVTPTPEEIAIMNRSRPGQLTGAARPFLRPDASGKFAPSEITPVRPGEPIRISEPARARLEQHRIPAAEVERAASLPAADSDPPIVARSRARLHEALKGDVLNSNPVTAFYDTAIITGWDVYKGTRKIVGGAARDFNEWSREMTYRLGKRVRPHLQDIWNELETGEFGPDRVLNRLRQTRLVSSEYAREALGGERPEYLNSIVDFMVEQRRKVQAGGILARDTAKAYFLTVSSQGADAIRFSTLQKKLGREGIEFDIPDEFATANRRGEKMIRPEDAAGAWLLGERGQRALADLDRGIFNEALWAEGARVRAAFGDDRLSTLNIFGEPGRGSNMRSIAEVTASLNAAGGDARAIGQAVSHLNGVKAGKQGFIKHLLGFGDSPTVDAVQINFWLTGKGDISRLQTRQAELARAVKDFSAYPALSNEVAGRIQSRIKQLQRDVLGGSQVPEDVATHVLHHWLWDRAKGTETRQRGMYEAMRESSFVATSRARLRESLSGQRMNANPLMDLFDTAVVTGADLYKAAKRFDAWGGEMINRLGDEVRPYLKLIYDRLKNSDESGFIVIHPTGPPTHPIDTVSALRKAGLLTGVKTQARNILGNTGMQGMEELARLPASIVDIGIAAVTGRRTVQGVSPKAFAESTYAAATDGVSQAWQIMKQGATDQQLAAHNLPREVVSGNPILDTYINGIFRFQVAQDTVFKSFATWRAMREQATIIARNEARRGLIQKSEINQRADEVLQGIGISQADQNAMALRAVEDAAYATFTNKNRVMDWAEEHIQAAHPAARFAVEMVAPFRRTPANIVARIFDYSPLGAAKGSYKLARSLLKGAFTDAEQRAFAQAMGRATIGSAAILLGYALAERGLATGLTLAEEHSERAWLDARGALAGAVRIGDTWLEVARYSPLGNLLALGASLHERREEGAGKALHKSIVPTLESQPLLSATGAVSDIIKKPERFARNALGSFVPTIVGDVAAELDTSERVSGGFFDAVLKKIPGARQQLAPKIDALGKDVPPRGGLNPIQMSQSSEPRAPALAELERHNLKLDLPPPQKGEGRKAYTERIRKLGALREERLNSVVSATAYNEPPAGTGPEHWQKQALEEARRLAAEDMSRGRKPRRGDEAVIFHNTRVSIERDRFLAGFSDKGYYRNYSSAQRKAFDESVRGDFGRARVQPVAHRSTGDVLSDGRDKLADLLGDRGVIIERARAQAARIR